MINAGKKNILHNTDRYLLVILLFVLSGSILPAFFYFKCDPLALQWFISVFFGLVLILCLLIKWVRNAINRNTFGHLFNCAASVVLTLECSFVFFHVFILKKEGVTFVSGTMNSPTGLAIAICTLFPFVLERIHTKNQISKYKKINGLIIERLFFLVVSVFSVVIVILTRCRTGILCLFLYLTIDFFIINRCNSRFFIIKTIIAVCLLVVFFVVSSTNIKQNSTKGRSLILSNSIELIKDKPICGYPPYGYRLAYMNKQADFFRNNTDSSYADLADEISHPLNEFVYIWINHGLFGFFLLLTVLFFPLVVCAYNKQRCLFGSLSAIFIFSSFSYPFLYPLTTLIVIYANVTSILFVCSPLIKRIPNNVQKNKIAIISSTVLSVLLVILIVNFSYNYRWNKASYRALNGDNTKALCVFEELSSHYCDNPYFLYNYMSESFHAGYLDKAYELSKRLHSIMSSYNLELLSGDLCYCQQRYEEAKYYYENAMYMCPCRFAPLEGLYKVYDAMGDMKEKMKIADIIAEKNVKVLSADVLRIINQCK